MPSVIEIESRKDFEEIISGSKITIVDFYTTWCGYCKLMTPVFERASEWPAFNTLQFYQANCTGTSSEMGELASKYNVDGYPHIMAFRDGEIFARSSGYVPWVSLKYWLEECIEARESADKVLPSHEGDINDMSAITEINDWDKFTTFLSQHKSVVAGFFMGSKPYSRSVFSAFSRAATSSKFKTIVFVLYNCDGDDELIDGYWLRHQSFTRIYRGWDRFAQLKNGMEGSTFEDWLADCLVANEIADSAIPDELKSEPVERADSDTEIKDQSLGQTVARDSAVAVPFDSDPQIAEENNKDNDTSGEGSDEAPNGSEATPEEEHVTEVNTLVEFQNLVSENKNLVATFYDPRDAFSQAMLLVTGRVASLYTEIKFCQIDVLDLEVVPEHMEGKKCPRIILFRNSVEVATQDGPIMRSQLEAWLKKDIEDVQFQSNGVTHGSVLDASSRGVPSTSAILTPAKDEEKSNVEQTAISIAAEDTRRFAPSRKQTNRQMSLPLLALDDPLQGVAANPTVPDIEKRSIQNSESVVQTALSPQQIKPYIAVSEVFPVPLEVTSPNDKGDVVDSGPTSSNEESSNFLIYCTGIHQDRAKSPFNWRQKRKPFSDPEPNCVFVPTPDGEGLQIGRANDGDSYFNITLWHSTDHDQGQISFGVGFGPDPTVKARFASAVFRVTFGYDDSGGKPHFLTIRDLSPQDQHGEPTAVHWGKGSEGNLSVSIGSSLASVSGSGTLSSDAKFTRKTASRVRGQGIHTQTAEWTFEEDTGQAGRHGLDPQYNLFVRLPTKSSKIWMEFWGKAVLVRGQGLHLGSDLTLKLGSVEEPYRRNLDLSNSSSTAR